MKQSIFTILSNTKLTDSVYKMVLSGDTSAITAPGQFVNIQLDNNLKKEKDYINVVIEFCIKIDAVDFLLNEIYEIFSNKIPSVEDLEELKNSMKNIFSDESPEKLEKIEL